MLCKYGKRTHNFAGRFYCYFSLVFYILRAFSTRCTRGYLTIIPLALLENEMMISPISYPTRARGIIIEYLPSALC